MARIDDYLVIQMAGTKVVLVDDRTGAERVVWDASQPETLSVSLTEIQQDPDLNEAQVALLHFWCGYFYAHAVHQEQ